MDLGRRGGEEELEGAEGVKTLIRIYYLKKNLQKTDLRSKLA